MVTKVPVSNADVDRSAVLRDLRNMDGATQDLPFQAGTIEKWLEDSKPKEKSDFQKLDKEFLFAFSKLQVHALQITPSACASAFVASLQYLLILMHLPSVSTEPH